MIENPSPELVQMGYDPSRMLFYKDTGDVSNEVWDVLLYRILEESHDKQDQCALLYEAHMNGDNDTKQAMHEHYYTETSTALRNHVDAFLQQLDELSRRAEGRDLNVHPRKD
jgi:hypothetical protein